MAKVTRLNVMISASAKGMSHGISSAQKKLDGLTATARRSHLSLSKIGAMAPSVGRGLARLGTAGAAGLAALGAGAVAATTALAAMGVAAIDAVGEQSDFAKSVGMSYNRLKAFQFAAQKAGIGGEKLNAALEKMSDFLGSAADGNATAQETLGKLGLTFEQIEAMAPERRFEAIANALNRIQDPAKKIAATRDIFGRSGVALIGIFGDVGGSIAAAAEKLKDFGVQLSDQSLHAIEAAGDALDDFKKMAEGVGTQVGLALSPYLIQAEKDTEAWIKSMGGISGIVDGGLSMLRGALDWIATKTDYLVVAWQKLTKLWDKVPDWMKQGPIGFAAEAFMGDDVEKRRADRAAGGGAIAGAKRWAISAEQSAINDFEAAQQAEVQAGHDRRVQARIQAGSPMANMSATPGMRPDSGKLSHYEQQMLDSTRIIAINSGKGKVALAG